MMAEIKRKAESKSESTEKDSQKQTFRFGDEFSTVQNFHISIWSAIRIRFLVLHGLNNLLARNHMTKDHMDTEKIQPRGVDQNLMGTFCTMRSIGISEATNQHLPVQMW